MKFCIYEVKSHGHWEIEEFNLGAFMFNMSLNKHTRCVAIVIFGTLLRCERERDTAVIELQLY
jgi:hypothetical protein